MKLGSLFDGSGTAPLAATRSGIEPVWASEIEPYPIAVTKKNFPNMKHLGSILDINGAEIEPVDIICGGSPCQDLSVAGKQAGLHEGKRSHLFFEMTRIIKEMRKATNGKYPRYVIWENVVGALSSGKPVRGADFYAVLCEYAQIADPTVHVPEPPCKANKFAWRNAGSILGNGWSLSWRVVDSQFWGVPQRRRRIYLVVDLQGDNAERIVFGKEHSTAEYPTPVIDTYLSDILDENVDAKYNLSEKACKGILSRAERRGKTLPPLLKEALEEVVGLNKGESASAKQNESSE